MDNNQLCWLPLPGSDKTKVLHWRTSLIDPWKSYTKHPLRKPDINLPTQYGKPSKGFTTAQYLLKLGWVYVPSPVENDENEAPQSIIQVEQ